MSYIGSAPSGEAGTYKNFSDVFSGNGSSTFTLSYNVVRNTDIEVVVNNVQQNPFDGSYSIVNNNVLTFSEVPSTSSNNIVISYKNFSKPVAVNAFNNASYSAANLTITVETSSSNVYVTLPTGNATTKGLLLIVDSVANTNGTVAASANSVKSAYELASNAVSNATGYSATAYTNAYNQAVLLSANAYTNAVANAVTLAATAYSNATGYADTKAATAYSNAVSVANTTSFNQAATAYSNAASYADTVAATAYSNAVSTSNTTSSSQAATAYSNAIATANTTSYNQAANAYANATSYADTKASAAYSNVFNGGTFSGNVIFSSNVTANTVRLTGNMQIDGDLLVTGNTVTMNVSSLSVEDNMIYLNASSNVANPDLGFAGNYNDGTYRHAGVFRDATDGIWKFFHQYEPEPDASAYIDTSNNTFALANVQGNYFIGNITGAANSASYLGGNTASDIRNYAADLAANAYANAITYASNASNISTGTLATARLPATANVSTAINVGANVNINATAYAVGNSTVNTFITSTSINTNGTITANTIVVGNVEQTQTNLNVDPAGTAFLNALIYG